MPIYEFICRECNGGFEKLTTSAQRDSVACPDCGSERTARHISLTAPAQIKAGGSSSAPVPGALAPAMGQGCGAPRCCGGMCGMPE